MMSVKGKWALVTGASRGIGYLVAKFVAQQGCNLVLHSRSLAHTAHAAGSLARPTLMGCLCKMTSRKR